MKLIKLWPPQTVHFFALAVICAVIGVFALRSNNLNMAELREQVFVADEANENLATSVDELRAYVYSHMNTSTTIELKYSYERDVEKVVSDATSSSRRNNENIFDDLPADCAGSSDFVDTTTPCVRDYINQRLREVGGDNSRPVKLPDKRLYVYSFESPMLSLDLAGISLVLSSLFGLAGLGLVTFRFIREEIKFYRGDIDGL